MRRVLLVVGIIAASLAVATAPAAAQTDAESPSGIEISEPEADGSGIIPKPNSGRAPESATDRGGALQLALLGLIVVFPIVAIVSVRRQARRSRDPLRAG